LVFGIKKLSKPVKVGRT